MKLNKITFKTAPRIAGIRAGEIVTIDCNAPFESMNGWQAVIRGGQIFLVSPPAWGPGPAWRGGVAGERRIVEVPRSECFLDFGHSGTDFLTAIEKELVKAPYVSEPFAKPAEVVAISADAPTLLAQLPEPPPHERGDA